MELSPEGVLGVVELFMIIFNVYKFQRVKLTIIFVFLAFVK